MFETNRRARRSALVGAGVAVGLFAAACVPTAPEGASPATTSTTPTSVLVNAAAGAIKVFPLETSVAFTDTMGAARSGGRKHEGQDLMAPKMTKVVAVVSGTITQIKHGTGGLAGNQVRLSGDDGFDYYYIHLNNDTPGTDDGRNRFDQAFADGLRVGQRVRAGEHIGYVGDSGNAEETVPHLHFEMHQRGGSVVNAYAALKAAKVSVFDSSATRPFGVLDSVTVGSKSVTVKGWALPATGDLVVPYALFLDGNPFAIGNANTSRPDVGAAKKRGPNHGFELTATNVPPGKHEVCVVLYNPLPEGGIGGRTRCEQVTVPGS